jgi:hypothetical protein
MTEKTKEQERIEIILKAAIDDDAVAAGVVCLRILEGGKVELSAAVSDESLKDLHILLDLAARAIVAAAQNPDARKQLEHIAANAALAS